jgi:hypothetical protein
VPRDVQLSVRTLPGGFEAAEIDGLRPTDAADDAVRAIVRNALWERGVACLRFADGLDDDQAPAVASMIGPIKDPIGRTRDGGELRYSEDRQIIDAGFVLTDELREELGDLSFGGLDPDRPGLFETFHVGQRHGAAQGGRRLPARRAPPLLAVHDRGPAAGRRQLRGGCPCPR